MKAILINNQARAMSIFWRTLIKKMRDRKMEVAVCVPPGDSMAEEIITNAGAGIRHYSLDRKGINPLHDLGSLRQLKQIFIEEKPDIIFTSTIKSVIYGCIAAKSANIPGIFATITGLGYIFETDRMHKKIVHWLGSKMYRFALKGVTGVFFQNHDDEEVFKKENIISPRQKIFFVHGTGVDTSRFSPCPFPESAPVFLLIARLLEAKGIADYAAAARILKTEYPAARFQLLGIPENGPGSLPLEQIKKWQNEGILEYLGQTRDVRPNIGQSHIAVLPSWREGAPTSIMEAMSMGRPCVVTDVPGCREVVENGVNGWLCKLRNPQSLANAMEKFLKNPESIAVMGTKSRQMAIEKFDADKVAEKIVYDMLQAMNTVAI